MPAPTPHGVEDCHGTRSVCILSRSPPPTSTFPEHLVSDVSRLFSAYDRGLMSRRQLLQALGMAAVATPFAGSFSRAFAQGQCAGRAADSSAACGKVPMKAPFAPTGWKTTLLDHFSMRVTGTTRLDFTLDPAALEGSASPTTFLARAYNGGNWAQTTRLSATPTSHSAELTLGSGTTDFALGNAGIDHYIVTAASPQTQGATFTTSVAAEDQFNQPVSDDNTTAVTMGSSGAVEYDANGDATFNDNVKTLTAGAFAIDTRDNTAETVNLTASDGNGKTGSRTGLVVLEPLAITTLSLPGATAGVAYSQTVAATGGTSPASRSEPSSSTRIGSPLA